MQRCELSYWQAESAGREEQDPSLVAASLAVIMQPAKKRKRDVDPFLCPCCNQQCLRVETLGRHLHKCCPDLLSRQAST